MLLTIWPHLTFGWPFVNISLTIHPIHSKLYNLVILITSREIWYTWKHLKHFENLTPTWPLSDPYWEEAKSSIILSKKFLIYKDFKSTITHFRQNGTWVFLPLQSSNELNKRKENNRIQNQAKQKAKVLRQANYNNSSLLLTQIKFSLII